MRVMAEPGGLNLLDDAFRDGWVGRMTKGLVFESLLTIDPKDFSLVPQLAEKWSESADHRTTTFTLRDATFSDGTPLRAADVVATFSAILDPKRPTGAIRGELSGLASCRAIDDKTVELTWTTPSPLSVRAVARVPIYPAAQLAGEWSALAQSPTGTGPFRIEKWDRGASLTLTRRDASRAHLEKIVFRFVKDHTTAAGLFERGEVDLMTSIQPVLWRAMEAPDPKFDWAKKGWNRLLSVDNSYSYIGWNEAVPALSDVRVRTAFAHLYNAQLIAKMVDLELEKPTTCPFFWGSDSCDSTVKPLPFSPPAASALLADAGFTDSDGDGVLDRDGRPLELTFLLPSASVRLGKLVPILQEQLKAVGVTLRIEKVETTTLSARVAKRDFEIVSRLWTEFDREQDVYPMFHSSQIDGGANFVGYSNAEVDRLLVALRKEFDVAKRRELEREVHRLLYRDQPYLFMTSRQSLDAAKTRVHGLVPSLLWYDLRAVWVDD